MNVLDYILLAILLVFLARGYSKGFVYQVLQISGVILAFIVASRFHPVLAGSEALSGVRERSDTAALVLAFIAIFFVVAAVASVIAVQVSQRASKLQIHGANAMLGALTGLAQGVLLLGGASLGLKEIGFPGGAVPLTPPSAVAQGKQLITDSVLVTPLAEGCLALVALIPQRSREEIMDHFRLYGEILTPEDSTAPENSEVTDGTGPTDSASTYAERRRARKEAARKFQPVTSLDAQPPPRPRMPDLGTLWKLSREVDSPAPPAVYVPGESRERDAPGPPHTSATAGAERP